MNAATMKFSRVNVWYLYETRADAWEPFTGDNHKQANAYIENVGSTEIWAVDYIERLGRDSYVVYCANGKAVPCDQSRVAYIYMGDDLSADPEVEEVCFIEWCEKAALTEVE